MSADAGRRPPHRAPPRPDRIRRINGGFAFVRLFFIRWHGLSFACPNDRALLLQLRCGDGRLHNKACRVADRDVLHHTQADVAMLLLIV